MPERTKPKSAEVTGHEAAISGLTARSLDESELVDEETNKLGLIPPSGPAALVFAVLSAIFRPLNPIQTIAKEERA